MFDCLFTEPLFPLRNSSSLPQPVSSNLKNSYTLSLMMRLHDFQRVIHETRRKIASLKQTSMGKFEASARLRQLQWSREIQTQEVGLLRKTWIEMNNEIDRLKSANVGVSERVRARRDALAKLIDALRQEKLRLLLMMNYLERGV